MAESRVLTEPEILRRLAQSEPLRKLSPAYLRKQGVAPFCDRKASFLRIVVADPRAAAVAEEIRLSSGMRSVEVLQTDRPTVEKLIQKLQAPEWTPASDPEARTGEPAASAEPSPPPQPEAPTPSAVGPPPKPAARSGARIVLAEPDGNLRFAAGHILEREGYGVTIVADLEELAAAIRHEPPDLVVVKAKLIEDDLDLEARVRRIAPRAELRIVPDFGKLLQGEPVPYSRLSRFFFDMIDLLLSILETGSGKPKGLTHARALYAKLVAQKLGLPRKTIDETTLAAYLADFGETLVRFRFGNAPEAGAGAGAGRDPLALVLELLKGLHPPYDVASILSGREPEPAGSAAPKARSGDAGGGEAPIGSRILDVADLFVREKWAGTSFEGIRTKLREGAGSRLDPRVAEALLGILRDEMFLDRLGQARPTVLIADPDGESAALVELRLANEGYDVAVARNGPEALRRARAEPPDLILSEVLLPGLDGYGLIEALKGEEATAAIPFVFVSSQGDSHSITQGLDLGAEDYLSKPPDLNVLVAKAKRFLARAADRGGKRPAAAGGLSGTLDQISLPDMLQILAMGRKTVRLDVTSGERSGSLFIQEGALTDAVSGPTRGTDAFYEVMTFVGGSFSVTPGVFSDCATIEESIDFLILEGVRRFDEASSGGREEARKT